MFDRVVTLEAVPANFSDEVLPAGTEGYIVEVFERPVEGYAIDLKVVEHPAGEARFESVILRPGQFRVLKDGVAEGD